MTLRREAGGSLQVDPNCCSLPPNILHAHFLSVQARILNVSLFLCLSLASVSLYLLLFLLFVVVVFVART